MTEEEKKLKLCQKIWDKMEDNNLKPISKWRFKMKEIMNWFLFFISILIGSLSFGIILLELFSREWDIYTRLTDSFAEYLFGVLPYFWILFLIASIIFGYYQFMNTEKGYQYSIAMILTYSVAISMFLGVMLYAFNLSHWVYNLSQEYIPDQAYVINQRDVWNKPEVGLIGGRLLRFVNENKIELDSFKQGIWIVDLSEVELHGPPILIPGKLIKVLGEIINEKEFKAIEIRPWDKIWFDSFEEEIKHQVPVKEILRPVRIR